MPFLLPREIVFKFFEHGDADFTLSGGLLQEDAALLTAHAKACEPSRDFRTILPLVLWSDGVTGTGASIKKCFQARQATRD